MINEKISRQQSKINYEQIVKHHQTSDYSHDCKLGKHERYIKTSEARPFVKNCHLYITKRQLHHIGGVFTSILSLLV